MEETRLYTIREVAKALNLSDARIRQMIASGEAHPKQMLGRTWAFTFDEIERLRHRPKRTGGPDKKAGKQP